MSFRQTNLRNGVQLAVFQASSSTKGAARGGLTTWGCGLPGGLLTSCILREKVN